MLDDLRRRTENLPVAVYKYTHTGGAIRMTLAAEDADLDGYQVGQRLRQKLGTSVHLVALTACGQPKERAVAGGRVRRTPRETGRSPRARRHPGETPLTGRAA
jgi:hypothetical protein